MTFICVTFSIIFTLLIGFGIYTIVVYRETISILQKQNADLVIQFGVIQLSIRQLNSDLVHLNNENKLLNRELTLLSSEVTRLQALAEKDEL